MPDHIIVPGDKLHIITRRLFPDDIRRHFAGEVTKARRDLCELRGYAFIFHAGTNEYRRRPEVRTRIFALGEAGHIVNRLPGEVDVRALEYRTVDSRLVITDMAGFSLDINEFGPSA